MIYILSQIAPGGITPGNLPEGGAFFGYILVSILSMILYHVISPMIKGRHDIDKTSLKMELKHTEERLKKLEEENRKLKEREEKEWEPLNIRHREIMMALRFIIPPDDYNKLSE